MRRRATVLEALASLRCAVVAAALALALPVAAAEPLPAPTGKVILTVSGNIEITNSPDGAEFDRDMLYALGLTEVRTNTAWTDGMQTFKGVLLRDIIARVGGEGTEIIATALNDFVAPVPMEEVEKFDVIVAAVRNGEEMPVSERGPLWIIYPRDDHPEIQEPRFNDRWVWQLRALHVQ